MSQQTWVETLITGQIDGPTLSNFTTAASVLAPAAIYTFPSNYFAIGKTLRVRAQGRMSSFTSGTFTWNWNLGTIASPIVQWNSGAFSTIISLTNITFDLEVMLTCRAVGGSAANSTLIGIGKMTSGILTGGSATGLGQAVTWLMPTSAPVVGSGFDSTITQVANLTLSCTVGNAANACTVHNYTLEAMN